MRNRLCIAVAVPSIMISAPISALAQVNGANPSYSINLVGTVPPIVRFNYVPASSTSGTLTVQICNTPVCEVSVEPMEPTDRTVTVRFDNGPPIPVNTVGPTIIYSGASMINETHSISVSGGTIAIEVNGR